jgi:hypothetical protein
MNKQRKWLDNYGKVDNANESDVSLPEGFVGMGYDTSGRNYSPSWNGQFQTGGSIPGTPGFTYARTAGSAPSEGKYAKKTMPSAQDGKTTVATSSPEYKQLYENRQIGRWLDDYNFDSQVPLDEVVVEGKRPSLYQDLRGVTKTVQELAAESTGIPGAIRFSENPKENIKGLIRTGDQTGLGLLGLLPGVEQTGFNYNDQDLEGAFNTLDTFGLVSGAAGLARKPIQKGLQQTGKYLTEETVLRNARKLNPFAENLNNLNKSYRVAGEDAYQDFLNTGVVQSADGKLSGLRDVLPDGRVIQIRRPTGFPSFQKGYADLSYADPSMKNYIYETSVPTFKRGEINPVTGERIKGRHYAHRPIDMNTGEVITQLPAKDVRVFESTPHWLKGYKEIPSSNRPMNLELFGFGKKKPAIAEDTPLSFLEKQTQVAKEELIRANKDAITFSQSPANRAKLQEFRPGENFSVSNQQARFTDDPEAIRLYESYKLDNNPTLSIDDYLGGIRGKYGARNYGDLNDVALINKNVPNTRNVPSKTVYTDAMHESTHSRSIRLGATDAESKIASDAWSPMIKQNDFGMPNEEAFAVQNELRTTKLKDLQGNRIYTDKDIPEIKKGLQEMINEGHDYLQGVNVKDFDMSAFIKSLNKIGIGAVAPVSAIGVSKLDKKQNGGEMKFYQEGLDWKPKSMQDGGIVEDDMGYWNPDNRGKPVRINSNFITMEGVYEPLLGIDDTGDTKLMLPGENYKFKGEKVTEYPLMQKGGRVGINQLDAQPKKKLNQLLNFTNNPDKNWLDNL